MIFVGIDPGQSGALARVGDRGALLEVVPMPAIGGEVAASQVAEILDIWSGGGPLHIFVEDVHAMPKQGVASSFKFGKSFGLVLGVIAAQEHPMTLVRPVRWKPEFRLTGKDKDMARLKAIEMWPDKKQCFKLKKDVDKAEAALIAEYGRRVW